MISILVYGRNDSYGYNLHKRVALSLNCMAAVLTDPSDEILFVDYNTQDDFPTLPEAIRDTLTPEARSRLRILRVRPAVHARYQLLTRLPTVEPVARNVAVRRSNPANRWILSTNTDMIFTPRTEKSLTELVRDLPAGYYGLPRFELPESLWESLDRNQPSDAMDKISAWGKKFHLNEIVYMLEVVKFDGPGDFQLATREDFFRIHGYNEAMLHGWHLDSNLCKRIYFLHGKVGDLSDGIYGYHCGHTRQMTQMHQHRTAVNSFDEFVHRVTAPDLPSQAETWGLAEEEIEEIRLDRRAPAFPLIMEKLAGPPLEKPLEHIYRESFDKVTYEPAHVLTFLADLFANAKKDVPVAWVGVHARMFDLFLEIRSAMGFTGPVLVCKQDADVLAATGKKMVEIVDIDGICERAGEFIFDFVRSNGNAIGTETGADIALALHLAGVFRKVVETERSRMTASPAPLRRRVIAINAIHNRFHNMVTLDLDAAKAPFNTRLRYGLVMPTADNSSDWLALAQAGPAGFRNGTTIDAQTGVEGPVVYGPQLPLPAGRYRALFDIEADKFGLLAEWKRDDKKRVALLDVISGTKIFGFHEIMERELKAGIFHIDFEISREDADRFLATAMETRAWTSGKHAFAVKSIQMERINRKGNGTADKRKL